MGVQRDEDVYRSPTIGVAARLHKRWGGNLVAGLHRRDGQLQRTRRGTAAIVITKATRRSASAATPACYDAAAHGATGTATGIGGAALSGLDLGASFTNVPGGTANWTFTDATGNYNNASGDGGHRHHQGGRDGQRQRLHGRLSTAAAHGATGTATGVGGAALSGLDLGDSFTNVPGGTANWTFTDATGNYNNASGTVAIVITKADATVSVTGYTASMTAAAHGATGTATGVGGEALSGLNLGASFTNVPGGTANWTFTDATGNYNNASGTAAIVITKADATVSVNGYTGVYDGGGARRDRHGDRRRRRGAERAWMLGDSFTNVPGGTANWNLHRQHATTRNASGTVAIVINKADATVTGRWQDEDLGEVFTAFTGEVVSLQGSDTGTATYASLGAAAAATVGSYDITATFTFANGAESNYNVQLNTAVKGLVVGYRWDGFLQPINDTAHDRRPDEQVQDGSDDSGEVRPQECRRGSRATDGHSDVHAHWSTCRLRSERVARESGSGARQASCLSRSGTAPSITTTGARRD